MTDQEFYRCLAAYPDFIWSAESKIDGHIGGWEGYDQYGYKKGKFTVFDNEDLNFKISNKSVKEFMDFLSIESDNNYICINNMSIWNYIKTVNKNTPISIKSLNNRLNINYATITIPGNEIEDWILDHDELIGIDPYTYLQYDHDINYIVIIMTINQQEKLQLIYPI